MKYFIGIMLMLLVVPVVSADDGAVFGSFPDLTIGVVQGFTSNSATGVALSYPLIDISSNYTIFADVGGVGDSATDTIGFFGGLSTDVPIPLISSLKIKTCLGIGWSPQSDEFLLYMRIPVL